MNTVQTLSHVVSQLILTIELLAVSLIIMLAWLLGKR